MTQPVSVIDMVTTALAAVGLEPNPEQRGVNLMDIDAVNARDAIYCDVYAHDMASLENPEETLLANFVVKDGWKLIQYPSGTKELYHLYNTATGDPVDPFETDDLSATETAKVAELLSLLNTWYYEPKDMDWSAQASQTSAVHSIDMPGELGQSFTVEASSWLVGIKIPLRQIDTNQAVTVELRELDGSNAPVGLLLKSATIQPDPVYTNDFRWCFFPFDAPQPVSAGQQLGFLVKSADQPNTGYEIAYSDTNAYSGGTMYYSGLIQGAAWDAANYDLPFQVIHANYSDPAQDTRMEFDDSKVYASMNIGMKGQPVLVQTSSNLTNGWVDVAEDPNLDGLVAASALTQSNQFFRFALSLTGGIFTLPVPDTSPPEVIESVPANGAVNVSPATTLALVFDEEIKAGSGNITIHLAGDGSVVQTIDVTSGNVVFSGAVMTINPTSNLDVSTAYYVDIPAGAVADLSDNAWPGISGAASWAFTTAAELTLVSPVHHWAFDEGSGVTTADAAGIDDGVISGASWASDGVRGSHLSFDGANDLVDPSLFLPQWSSSNAETWAVWIKDAGGNNNDIILGNRLDGGTAAGGRLFAKMTIAATSGRFVYNDGTAYAGEFSALTPGYTGNFPDGTWVHVAIVRDGADFTFYVDGNLVNSSPVTIAAGDMPTAAMPFFMGGEAGNNGSEFFNGGLDDVVIYDVALSSSEVLNVMNGIYEF